MVEGRRNGGKYKRGEVETVRERIREKESRRGRSSTHRSPAAPFAG